MYYQMLFNFFVLCTVVTKLLSLNWHKSSCANYGARARKSYEFAKFEKSESRLTNSTFTVVFNRSEREIRGTALKTIRFWHRTPLDFNPLSSEFIQFPFQAARLMNNRYNDEFSDRIAGVYVVTSYRRERSRKELRKISRNVNISRSEDTTRNICFGNSCFSRLVSCGLIFLG